MRARIIALGDANVDIVAFTKSLPARGGEGLIQKLEMRAGGSAANFALAISRLGMDPGLIAKVGDDLFGHFLIERFQEGNVNVDQLQIGNEDRTGMVFCIVTEDGERTMLTSRGINIYLRSDEIEESYIEGADALHISGYSLLNEPQRSAALKALEVARKRNLLISIDPGLLAPEKASEVLRSVLRSVDLILLNDVEAVKLTGETPIKAARKLLKFGLKVVALKLGSRGCLILTGQDQVSIPAYSVRAIDSTGAGDVFDAGFLSGFVRGWDLERIARFANAAGAVKVAKTGPSLPSKREVEEFMKREGADNFK